MYDYHSFFSVYVSHMIFPYDGDIFITETFSGLWGRAGKGQAVDQGRHGAMVENQVMIIWYGCWTKHRVFFPKMDGKNNGKPYFLMDDLGVPLFLETPIWIWFYVDQFKQKRSLVFTNKVFQQKHLKQNEWKGCRSLNTDCLKHMIVWNWYSSSTRNHPVFIGGIWGSPLGFED